jgi:glycosyltransferase involved in cell wall biosynthesis
MTPQSLECSEHDAASAQPYTAAANVALSQTIAFASSAFNEEQNLERLYALCLQVFEDIGQRLPEHRLEFEMVLVDNASHDSTPDVIRSLVSRDTRVKGYRNLKNYGPEPSFMQALQKTSADIVVLLCADLQDPPEVAGKMLFQLLSDSSDLDAVLACKKRSAGTPIIRRFRKMYYTMISFSDRDSRVVPGFHGFGCYRRDVIDNALALWRETSLNMRQCLSYASSSPDVCYYAQPNRTGGRSSYSFLDYLQEASAAIFGGKSFASRFTLRFGFIVFAMSILIGLFVVLNFLVGHSGYAGGIPTLAVLILLSSSFQVILLSLVSRQIEQGLHRPARPKVRSTELLA